MKHIKDPVYGFLELDRPFLELVDSPDFQRLRHIKQLGLTSLVYPSANHTRFEHSLGCYHLAKVVNEKFQKDGNEFIAAALFHDLGHLPFSHSLEKLHESKTGKKHSDLTLERLKKYSKILKQNGMDIRKIRSFIKGRTLRGRLLSGKIDIDRMDYLIRDAYYTGVAYGLIDNDNILRLLKITGKRIGVNKRRIHSIESLILARYLMFPTVYSHPTARIAESMLRRAVQDSKIEDLSKMDDIDLTSKLREKGNGFMKRIDERNLYKESVNLKRSDINKPTKLINLRKKFENFKSLEDTIAKKAGLEEGEVILDIPGKPKLNESKLYIFDEKNTLENVSPLVKKIREAEWNTWYVGVYTLGKYRNKLNKQKVKNIMDNFL